MFWDLLWELSVSNGWSKEGKNLRRPRDFCVHLKQQRLEADIARKITYVHSITIFSHVKYT